MSPSLRSRALVASTALWLRPLADRVPATASGVKFARVLVAGSMRLGASTPRDTRVEKVDTRSAGGARIRGEWVSDTAVSDTRRVILYVHGSAYAICSAATHRALVARLSRTTGVQAFTVEYRLAPEYRFPAAADDVRAAYLWLIESGHAPEDIILAGDSAGGHLILDLVAENARTGFAQPGAAVMLSPLFDLTFSLAAQREQRRRDPMISARAARRLVAHYTHGLADDTPRLRLALSQGITLPPMLVQAGGAEMLSADAEAIADAVVAAGGSCELQIYDGQMHVFQAFPRLVPEADRALRAIARFVSLHTTAQTSRQRSA
ncbi:hypothetical protein GCM10007298_06100 [Williamsia phyllosphaerae]|uniref:Alpha/beta hydrolase fold-3 domain-containing protein n=1 Tax=Williamsia phyllosphaerae TaxID=885042 RepID=A0ABQ1U9H3_9NOCA|nr:hypothetical protein GCM10007298_06100 [Williamsia phyllosphaerae]